MQIEYVFIGISDKCVFCASNNRILFIRVMFEAAWSVNMTSSRAQTHASA